jgi:long-chain acyl-CoA synthetase
VPIVEGYGQSESTVVITANPPQGIRKPGTVGLPLPGQDVRIVGLDDEQLPSGEAGEVVVTGANVMRGYLGRPDETANTLRGGWLHTGDVGRLDADGYLVLVDRVKDLIIRGGENIYPKEIEDVLYTHPAVFEVAVVARAHPVFGEEPVAFVSFRSGHDVGPQELIEHSKHSLARFKFRARSSSSRTSRRTRWARSTSRASGNAFRRRPRAWNEIRRLGSLPLISLMADGKSRRLLRVAEQAPEDSR